MIYNQFVFIGPMQMQPNDDKRNVHHYLWGLTKLRHTIKLIDLPLQKLFVDYVMFVNQVKQTFAILVMLNLGPITAIYVIFGCPMMNHPTIVSNVVFAVSEDEKTLDIVTIVACASILSYSMITTVRLANI